MSSETIAVGTKGVYTNAITGMKCNCEVSKEVSKVANVIPVNLFNADGIVEYKNAWVSRENIEFV